MRLNTELLLHTIKYKINATETGEASGSRGNDYEDAVQSGMNLWTFRRNVLPRFWRNILRIFVYTEDKGSTIFRKVCKLLPDYTASHTRGQ
jgi:hypothetical protein